MNESSGVPYYKVRLSSGRVLGPLTAAQLKPFIAKGHLSGVETVRSYPSGEWEPLSTFSDLAELFPTGTFTGGTETVPLRDAGMSEPALSATVPLVSGADPGAGDGAAGSAASAEEEYEKTMVGALEGTSEQATEEYEKTTVGEPTAFQAGLGSAPITLENLPVESGGGALPLAVQSAEEVVPDADLGRQSTVMVEIPEELRKKSGLTRPANQIKAGLVAAALLLVVSEILFPDDEPTQQQAVVYDFKPVVVEEPLPEPSSVPDPRAAEALFNEGRAYYLKDTYADYRRAVAKFKAAAQKDPENIKAYALLASSYLNLIDVSNRDERYFLAISRMLEFCRARGSGLTEAVMADVEFYITLSRPDAAYNRVVDFARLRQNAVDAGLYYYLAYATFAKGDPLQAAGLINQIPDSQIVSPRMYFLRGEIADKLGQTEDAITFYKKALEKAKLLEYSLAVAAGRSPQDAKGVARHADHPRSRLRLAQIFTRIGKQTTEAKPHIERLIESPSQLSITELAQMHYFRSQIYSASKKATLALDEIRRARKYDPENRSYVLELASLESKSAGPNPKLRSEARMLALFTEAEQYIAAGDSNRAVTTYIKAAQENHQSPLAHEKLGDYLMKQNDLPNARRSYETGSRLDPKDSRLMSKYIDALIRSYDWEEAKKAMEAARSSGNPLKLDKAMGDMFARQNKSDQALIYYRAAMSKGSIDPELYVAYGNLLMSLQQHKDAPFYYSMALRFDPSNVQATIGIARAIAAKDGILAGIRRLEEELGKTGGARAEIMAAIAELNIQRGEWAEAERFINQAKEANPEYPYPHKLEAQIFLNREGIDKGALDKALAAYKSFSDRNPADPTGYLERYRIYIRKAAFQAAVDELQLVRQVYPKYPNLNYYEGVVRALQGNHQGYRNGNTQVPGAIDFFKRELENHPGNLNTMLSLAKSLIEAQRLVEARDILTEARSHAPKSAEIAMQAGKVYILLKQYTAGMALLRSSLALDSSNPAIYRELGWAYVAMQDRESARQNFNTYLAKEPNAPDRGEIQRHL